MKRCPNCNRAYSDSVKVCSACGADLCGNTAPVRTQTAQNRTTPEQKTKTSVVEGQIVKPVVQNNSAQNNAVQNNAVNDSGSILWGLPGLFFPIAGWILYYVWKDKKPKTAKVANIGAWIGFASALLMTIAGM